LSYPELLQTRLQCTIWQQENCIANIWEKVLPDASTAGTTTNITAATSCFSTSASTSASLLITTPVCESTLGVAANIGRFFCQGVMKLISYHYYCIIINAVAGKETCSLGRGLRRQNFLIVDIQYIKKPCILQEKHAFLSLRKKGQLSLACFPADTLQQTRLHNCRLIDGHWAISRFGHPSIHPEKT
jgi:hypothetical protein